MSHGTILLIILILVLVGVIPTCLYKPVVGVFTQRRDRADSAYPSDPDPALIGPNIVNS